MLVPREYQNEAVDSLFEYFYRATGNPLLALPTGSGKSLILAMAIKRMLQAYPTTRVMMLTHVKELIDQNRATLKRYWQNAPVGVYSSGLGSRDSLHPIIFGGVKTVVNQPAALFGRIDILFIDECHLISPKAATSYQLVIGKLQEANPRLKVVGLTATPYRLGQGSLLEEGGIFTDVCYDLASLEGFNRLLEEGYLAYLIPKKTNTGFDLSGVHTTAGDYNAHELEEAVNNDAITRLAIQELIANGIGRQHWLCFAAGINHAESITDLLNEAGVRATCVHSKMPDKERDRRLADFMRGNYRACVNNGVLTTGFDFPAIDLIGGFRPTKSSSLHVQMLGRGTRPVYAPGFDLATKEGRLAAIATSSKPNCLVMDFAGNVARLGAINDPVIPKPKGSKGAGGSAPIKLCGECFAYNHATARFCVNCGVAFPLNVAIEAEASTLELIAATKPPVVYSFEVYDVDRVLYSKHVKAGSDYASLKVNYFCGLQLFTEFVNMEHPSGVRNRALKWWRERCDYAMPSTVDEALRAVPWLKPPKQIQVKHGGKFAEVTARL